MAEPTNPLLLRREPAFKIASIAFPTARISIDLRTVSIYEADLSITEARHLRDWLTSVLPVP